MDFSVTAPDYLRTLDQWSLVRIALIIVAAIVVIVATQHLLPWIGDRLPPRYRLYLLATVPVVRLLAIVLAMLMIIPELIEPTFENVFALFGALAILLGFALKDYVSSLAAGIVALYEMPYRPGDWIEVDGAYGEVKRLGMRAVEITTPDDTNVTIPHLKLWTSAIRNGNDGTQYLMCVASFYLHPEHDGDAVQAVLYDIALTSAFLQHRRPIKIVAVEQPWGTHYRLKAYPIDPRDQFDFITDLTLRGRSALSGLGVQFVNIAAVSTGSP